LRYFDTPAYEQLVAAWDGVLSYWDGNQWNQMVGWSLADALVRFEAAQGVDKLAIVDGTDFRIWNGATFEGPTGTGATDPPKGATVVLWHASRMWAAGFSGTDPDKFNDAIWGSTLLSFGAGDWDKTDRNFRISGGDGDPIIGLASLSSSLDKGFVMAVLKQNSLWLVNTDPRAQFTNFTANLGPERISDASGVVGRRAFCVYGNDLLFVCPDRTIRSLARMQAAAGQYQLSPPLSTPIQPFVDRINWDFAHLIAAIKYRHLALFAVPLDASRVNNTVLVWNGHLNKWTGIWTGWNPNCFEVSRFSGVHRLVFGDNVGKVPQWKDWKDAQDDATYMDDDVSYRTKLWTRSMLFGEPLNDKDAFHCEERFAASNALITTTAVADNADWKTWDIDIRPARVDLPIPQLPFNLADNSNAARRKGLRNNRSFNEIFLKLESDRGWFEVRNLSLSAFINTLRNQ
jgi:hypothetical protein